MKIRYKKRHFRVNLIFGIVWLVWFFLGILFNDEMHWIDYGWLLISAMYLGFYFYQRKNQYLVIEDGVLKENSIFGKEMNLKEVKWIKSFAGDYILKSETKKLQINTQIIDPDSLADLNTELKKLNADWS